jgi:transcriptional regulator with XRE-family HTH domain
MNIFGNNVKYRSQKKGKEVLKLASLTLASWLRLQLLRHNLSQRQFANEIGLSTGLVSNILAGKHVPKVNTVRLLADFFQADEATVLEIAGLLTMQDLPTELDPEVKELIRRLNRLEDTERRVILTQVNQFIDLLNRRGEPVAAETR